MQKYCFLFSLYFFSRLLIFPSFSVSYCSDSSLLTTIHGKLFFLNLLRVLFLVFFCSLVSKSTFYWKKKKFQRQSLICSHSHITSDSLKILWPSWSLVVGYKQNWWNALYLLSFHFLTNFLFIFHSSLFLFLYFDILTSLQNEMWFCCLWKWDFLLVSFFILYACYVFIVMMKWGNKGNERKF